MKGPAPQRVPGARTPPRRHPKCSPSPMTNPMKAARRARPVEHPDPISRDWRRPAKDPQPRTRDPGPIPRAASCWAPARAEAESRAEAPWQRASPRIRVAREGVPHPRRQAQADEARPGDAQAPAAKPANPRAEEPRPAKPASLQAEELPRAKLADLRAEEPHRAKPADLRAGGSLHARPAGRWIVDWPRGIQVGPWAVGPPRAMPAGSPRTVARPGDEREKRSGRRRRCGQYHQPESRRQLPDFLRTLDR